MASLLAIRWPLTHPNDSQTVECMLGEGSVFRGTDVKAVVSGLYCDLRKMYLAVPETLVEYEKICLHLSVAEIADLLAFQAFLGRRGWYLSKEVDIIVLLLWTKNTHLSQHVTKLITEGTVSDAHSLYFNFTQPTSREKLTTTMLAIFCFHRLLGHTGVIPESPAIQQLDRVVTSVDASSEELGSVVNALHPVAMRFGEGNLGAFVHYITNDSGGHFSWEDMLLDDYFIRRYYDNRKDHARAYQDTIWTVANMSKQLYQGQKNWFG